MGKVFRWLLWLWMSGTILAAFYWAPLSLGFNGLDGSAPQSSRIVFFHVPTAIAAFIAFLAAGVWGVLYLIRRRESDDHSSRAAVEVGLVFCILATVTGAVWSKVQWGAYWNWDPRQTSIALTLLFYGAYLSLRQAVEDTEVQARLAAAYAALGLAVAPFLFFIMPRMASFSLHPKPASAEFDAKVGLVLLAACIGHTALFFWIQRLRSDMLGLEGIWGEEGQLAGEERES